MLRHSLIALSTAVALMALAAPALGGSGRVVRATGPDAVYLDAYEDVTMRVQSVTTAAGATKVTLKVAGFDDAATGATFPTHVHANRCEDDQGGPHYNNPDGGDTIEEQEIWLTFEPNAGGQAHAKETVDWVIAEGEAQSVVIHAPDGTKAVCTNVAFGM